MTRPTNNFIVSCHFFLGIFLGFSKELSCTDYFIVIQYYNPGNRKLAGILVIYPSMSAKQVYNTDLLATCPVTEIDHSVGGIREHSQAE